MKDCQTDASNDGHRPASKRQHRSSKRRVIGSPLENHKCHLVVEQLPVEPFAELYDSEDATDEDRDSSDGKTWILC
jgi:hypothetical protein